MEYSTIQLKSAAMFCRLCGKVEMEKKETEKLLGYTVESIILSISSLEAYIHEIISSHDEYLPDINRNTKNRLFYIVETGIPALEKYERTLSILKADAVFDKDAYPYEDMVVLKNFRNSLVHFYPEWHADEKIYMELEEKLRGINFKLNPFYHESQPAFPYRYIGYGCTQWAVKTVYDFMETFCSNAGIPLAWSKTKEMFNTDIAITTQND